MSNDNCQTMNEFLISSNHSTFNIIQHHKQILSSIFTLKSSFKIATQIRLQQHSKGYIELFHPPQENTQTQHTLS